MTKLNTTCTASITASVLSGALWIENITSIFAMIGSIISAVFGLVSLAILIYNKVKKKVDDKDLNFNDILDLIKEGKEGAEPYIHEIVHAIEEYQDSKNKED